MARRQLVIKGREIDVTDAILYDQCWFENERKERWIPGGPPTTFRVQRVDLDHGAFVVWVTNGVAMKTYLVDTDSLGPFLKRQMELHDCTVLDDSGIGLDNILEPRRKMARVPFPAQARRSVALSSPRLTR